VAGALDGIRILDLTWGSAGPLGVLLLAEQGADVIKVEPPDGDPFRAHQEAGYAGYKVWTRSRRSARCNLKSDAGRAAFLDLAKTADVIVESYRPGVLDRLGIGWDVLHAVNPRLVLVSVPGYPAGHRNADRPGHDALVQAASGAQWEQPGWRPGPIFLSMPLPSVGAIFLVASGALSGLLAREETGRGQHVQTSLLQGVWLYSTQIWQWAEHADASVYGLMAKSHPPGVHQPMIFECADREFCHVSVMSGMTPTKTLDEILGTDPVPAEQLEGLLPLQQQNLMNERRRDAFKRWNCAELIAELIACNHIAEAVVEPEDQFAHPQLQANGMAASVDDPELGATTQIGVPIHLLGTPGAIQGGQPRVGEHDAEVWGELGITGDALAAVTSPTTTEAPADPSAARTRPRLDLPESAPEHHALGKYRLIDFGQYLAGPFGPMILGDLGMDVIKVEPVTGDGMRMAATPFFGCQRGKRDLALDLKSPEGLEIALKLVGTADVAHHNMTKGTAGRLKLDYEACKAVRDDIIYCNTYAYGLEGPLSHFGGLDPLYQASSGIEHELGATNHGHDPLYYRYGMCDAANALLSIVGVLEALVHRERTGEGQELWTSLMDGGAVFASDTLLLPDGTPAMRPKLDAGQHGFGWSYRLYETDDNWICVAALTADERDRFLATVGVDPRLQADPTPAIEATMRTKNAVMWSHTLDDVDVPNEIALDNHNGMVGLFDADLERLGMIAEYDHPTMGRMRQFGELVHFSETPGLIRGPAPRIGEHSREILEDLGFSGKDQEALRASGVVTWPDETYAAPW
jgi:crotonobetainyl-CoA:carnitine CoA-transferase CaiB-like acyl-CoA transferase